MQFLNDSPQKTQLRALLAFPGMSAVTIEQEIAAR
jgi:hypothetical protein